jgi:hypothetical protein
VSFTDVGALEVQHLERWIAAKPELLGERLLVITTQFAGFDRTRDRSDILALDEAGKLVVIELKRESECRRRDSNPRDADYDSEPSGPGSADAARSLHRARPSRELSESGRGPARSPRRARARATADRDRYAARNRVRDRIPPAMGQERARSGSNPRSGTHESPANQRGFAFQEGWRDTLRDSRADRPPGHVRAMFAPVGKASGSACRRLRRRPPHAPTARRVRRNGCAA